MRNSRRRSKKKESGWKRCTRAASVLVRKEQITLCSVNGSWWAQATRRERWESRQTSVSVVAEHQSSVHLSLPARTEPWHDCREGFRACFLFFVFFFFRIAEFYVVGVCCRRGFERAVICDWTQCATWRLLCLLLPGLFPSPLPPAVFGLWSWLRSRASPRCVAVIEWKVRPINTVMGAKQMKW